jgi:predicted phosphodiesterase
MESGNTFNWMHISDFHSGMKESSNRWDQIKIKFHQDIKRHCQKYGEIDVVIFSGDLTQAGKKEEFESVLLELKELWEVFSDFAHQPSLFIIPGNHDLKRPAIGAPISIATKHWKTDPELEEELFNTHNNAYLNDIKDCFNLYTDFINNVSSQLPLITDHQGVLPGESSAVWKNKNLKVGFIGLNTAWSHIKNGDMKGKLEISRHQIHKAVPDSLENWITENDINFLVTHHPSNWLTEKSQHTFNNDINPLGRFNAHLFGHMHEAVSLIEDYGNEAKKRSIQAASLFGLEVYGEGNIERQHGYYYAQVSIDESTLKIWPKKALPINGGGGWSIRADASSLPEEETEAVTTHFPLRKASEEKKK